MAGGLRLTFVTPLGRGDASPRTWPHPVDRSLPLPVRARSDPLPCTSLGSVQLPGPGGSQTSFVFALVPLLECSHKPTSDIRRREVAGRTEQRAEFERRGSVWECSGLGPGVFKVP